MCDIHLFTTRALAPDINALVRALEFACGHVTSLELDTRPFRHAGFVIPPRADMKLGSIPAKRLVAHAGPVPSPEQVPELAPSRGLLEEMAADGGIEPDDIGENDWFDNNDDIGPDDFDPFDLEEEPLVDIDWVSEIDGPLGPDDDPPQDTG
jgi:hypothetical protein